MVRAVPTLRQERALLASGARLVAGMDEVGRGALAGPVSVGVVVVDAATRTGPKGVADSKLLTPAAREAIAPAVRRWAVAWGVGHAGPAEIDEVGIIAALRMAGRRALAQVRLMCGDVDVVVLDGKHDWLSTPVARPVRGGGRPGRRRARPRRPDADQGRHDLHVGGRRQRAGQGGAGRRSWSSSRSGTRSTPGTRTRATAPRPTWTPWGCTGRRRSTADPGTCPELPRRWDDVVVSAEDLENYETEMELALYREYRDVVGLFSYVVETERRFYLANQVDLQVRSAAGEVYFELRLADAWVWDVYRSARFVKSVRVVTFNTTPSGYLRSRTTGSLADKKHRTSISMSCPGRKGAIGA